MLRSSYWRGQDMTRVRAGSKSCLLCYTRERVKREEKEILQHETTSLYIHFVCHPRIIPHAPMYHVNIQSWSYTPPTITLISTITPHHPMSQHLRPLPYRSKVYRHHPTIFPHGPCIYPHLRLSVTLTHSIALILLLSTLQRITRNSNRNNMFVVYYYSRIA